MARAKDDRTLDLFDVPQPAAPLPGAMDYRSVVCGIVTQMLRDAMAREPEIDRHDIAARVSRLTGKEVSKYMLDAYTSEAREEFNAPAWLMPALAVACDSLLYANWIASVHGGRLSIGREVLTAELGKLERQKIELERLIKNLKSRVVGS